MLEQGTGEMAGPNQLPEVYVGLLGDPSSTQGCVPQAVAVPSCSAVSAGSASHGLKERAPGPRGAGSSRGSLPGAPESTESVSACRVRTFLRDVGARGPLWEFLMDREMALGRGSAGRRQHGRNLPMALLKSLMKSG